MNIERIKYLRRELEAERIDLVELSEIEAAFAEIPDDRLRARANDRQSTSQVYCPRMPRDHA